MIEPIPPAFLFLFGAWLIPLLKGKIKQGYLLLIPALAFIDLLLLEPGSIGFTLFFPIPLFSPK
ncbi:MAG: hypothetical protein MUP68_00390 [Deltaproteobacteria bacterium]|nr:hypothetical protein [Deltaproteobacteria bacterium]